MAHLVSSAVRICLVVVTHIVYSCRLLIKVTCTYVLFLGNLFRHILYKAVGF